MRAKGNSATNRSVKYFQRESKLSSPLSLPSVVKIGDLPKETMKKV